MASAAQLVETTGKDRIRAGVGTSEHARAGQAGRLAAREALAELAGEPAALVLVYGSVRYQLADLLAGVRGVTGDTPLAGASSSGHLHNGTIMPPGQGVVVLTVSAGPYRFGVASVTGLSRDSAEVGRELARAARRAADPAPGSYSALMLLSDGLVGNQQELVSGAFKVTGAAVPVVGGAAADDRRLEQTSVFHEDQVLTDAAVAVWISAPWPLPVAVGHGWRPVGMPLLVTAVDGPVVHELAGQAAVALIREQFQLARWGQEPGWLHASGYHPAHAFGLIQSDGSQLIRAVYLGDDGRLRTLVPVPLYTPIQVVTCDRADLLGAVAPVVTAVTAPRQPSVLLAFSCLSRLELMGEDRSAEAAALHKAAGEVTSFGFYTYGEFARTTGVAGYHNAALTMIAL